jgi:hypothetical protein
MEGIGLSEMEGNSQWNGDGWFRKVSVNTRIYIVRI